MKKRIVRYLKHLSLTVITCMFIFLIVGLFSGHIINYNKNNQIANLDNEGPYVFYLNDSLVNVNYIKGSEKKGFYLNQKNLSLDTVNYLKCSYPIDTTEFTFMLQSQFVTPKDIYNDGNKILAISDIESNYKTFRDFLINNKVIDSTLSWTFGKNHLVLVGDFIDRSYFSTQVLWFIYKLEQEAKKSGGNVHYILGNHEIMNMQGNHTYAKYKYKRVAAILGKKQFDFYSKNSFLGKWLASKNTLEMINGNLFVHAGIHPKIIETNLNITQINKRIRENYYIPYYSKKDGNKKNSILTSPTTAPYWYRGYFKNNLPQEEVDKSIEYFKAKTVIVGHTLQSKINRLYQGKIIAIDVKHPKDYYKHFPKLSSEALLIENNKYFRVFENGDLKELK